MKSFDVRLTSEGTSNARNNVYETDTSRTIEDVDKRQVIGTESERKEALRKSAGIYLINRENAVSYTHL